MIILNNLKSIILEIKLMYAEDTNKIILLISSFLLVFLIRSLIMMVDSIFVIDEYSIQRIIFIISTSLLIMGLEIGFTKLIFIIIDNNQSKMSDVFNYFHLLGRYISGLFLFYLSISIGLLPGILFMYWKTKGELISIFFNSINDPYFQELVSGYFSATDLLILIIIILVPGVYLSLRLCFWSYFIIDKEITALNAIKKSLYLSKDKEFEIISYLLIILLFNLLGLISIIGICFTIPLTYLFLCKYFRMLNRNLK
ncbi:hypothetical protein OAQ87_00195 [Candidatus Marinimicrobia bacterium]|nr:hypothetical protein [Candidatus Neomarinimicrobiota bacterium]